MELIADGPELRGMEATIEDFNDASWHQQQMEELAQTYQQTLAQDPGYEAFLQSFTEQK